MDSNSIVTVVIGEVHHNTLGVIRSLGEAGIAKNNLFLIMIGKDAEKSDFVSKSKYVIRKHVYYCENDAGIKNVLFQLNPHNKYVIICCSDGSAEVVIKSEKELKGNYYIPNIGCDINLFLNKQQQSELAKENGFSIPESKVIELNKHNYEWNIFPCITKPLKSVMGARKADIQIANNRSELEKILSSTESTAVQIQEHIEKDFEYQLIGCSLAHGEKVIIPGYTIIIRQPKNTNTGYLSYNPINSLNVDLDKCKRFLQTIKYEGLFSMEFIRGKDGKDYYLETNLRNDGNAYVVKSAGINLPFIWAYYKCFEELPKQCVTSFDKKVYFIPDLFDIKPGIKEKGIIGWCKQFFASEAHAVYAINDIIPFLYQGKILVKKVMSKKLRIGK